MASPSAQPEASRLSTGDLLAELRLRRAEYTKLSQERDRLRARLADIETRLSELAEGGVPPEGLEPTPRRKAPARNDQTLADALATVLEGKRMRVAEAIRAVREAGYQSDAANFRIMVNQVLIKDPRFERVEHGVYTCAAPRKNARSARGGRAG